MKSIWEDEHPPFEHWRDRAAWALLRAGGLSAESAGYVMWNHTCYPMDSDCSLEQVNDYLEKNGYFPKSATPKKKIPKKKQPKTPKK